ncbi:helix-turn-helix domain-containing protein [Nocardioides sp. YIM 152315]|uniref:PucR family transcriptional regulator n=1 Tax=Nocardioides sp. YIM 152315 TaxID=3031760 RepID=UPI0023DB13A6|nr:helix-turn-helix domain-containing protein [Nocardioides sp. YIM 152315]MDF1603008.1 helix-turn-helix domain-containing protein [Nocardioides sp. YIM 152315]
MLISGDREELASAALARVDALHTGLTQIVLEGGNLDGIAAEVSRVLGVGVAFTSTDGRVRASALSPELEQVLADHQLMDPTGRVRVERIDTHGTAVGPGAAHVSRVAAGGADLGRLVCLRPDEPITADDVHALERAAAVAALLITREAAVSAVENKYQGDFLRDVLLRRSGRSQDPAYVGEHAETFGWDLERPVVVVVAELDPAEPNDVSSSQHRVWQERFSAAWRQVCGSIGDGIPNVDLSTEVVVLLPLTDDGTDAESKEPVAGHDVVRRAVTAVAGDRGGGRRPFSVGVSRVATSLDALPAAYAQARRAVEVGRRISGSRSTTFFDQLGLHRLIALIPDTADGAAELRAFVEDVLGPLAEPTTEAADLRETLQVLLDTNFNVAEAARMQFFHYNTMRYRVSKLERLLGPLSSDPHLRLDVAVALRVLEIAA